MAAGCIFKTKFVASGSKAFKAYIDYIDRDEAIRARQYDEYNIFESYHDYMDNPEKSTGLFTAEKDVLSLDDKNVIKNEFTAAQQNNGLMFQSIFSFTWDWLKETGLADEQNSINEPVMRDYIRASMRTLQKEEGIHDWPWSAAIHYNTEHVHVHIAMADPAPYWEDGKGRCYRNRFGQLQQRGKIKAKSIEKTKGRFINLALDTAKDNKAINMIIRDQMLACKKTQALTDDINPEIRQAFSVLFEKLPKDDLQNLQYNMSAMDPYRAELDNLSMLFIRQYCPEDYLEYKEIVLGLAERYHGAYGDSTAGNNFVSTKEKDLLYRMGNAILKEYKTIIKNDRTHQLQSARSQAQLNHKIKASACAKKMHMNRAIYAIKKATRKNVENLKNQAAYERLQHESEADKEK